MLSLLISRSHVLALTACLVLSHRHLLRVEVKREPELRLANAGVAPEFTTKIFRFCVRAITARATLRSGLAAENMTSPVTKEALWGDGGTPPASWVSPPLGRGAGGVIRFS